MNNIYKIFTALSLFSIALTSYAVGTFIPAPNRIDMSHDFSRNLVYISNGTEVLRYDVNANTFMPSYILGGSLSGMDISPDGNTLAVADRTRSETEVWVHLVNLNTGVASKVVFPRAFYEGGTFTVSYGNDGKVLVTSTFEGSGWVPLRKYDPATDTHEEIRSVRQNTMLAASGDAGTIVYAENNISSGPIGRYNVASQTIDLGPGTGWFNYEIGTNSNGTRYSVPTYGGTFIYDQLWNLDAVIGTYAGPQPIGVVYHPVENRVYYPWASTSEVREFDTLTNTQVGAYNFEHNFTNTGNHAFGQGRMKISNDGSLLMSTVTGGVRIVQMYAALNASNQSVVLDEDTSRAITLSGSIGNSGTLSYTVNALPAIGVLTGTAPDLIYTPNENAFGTDSFSYSVQYGGAIVNATVSIVVNPVNDAPVAVDDFIETSSGKVTVLVLLNDYDVDGDALTIISVTRPVNRGRAYISEDGQTILYRSRNRKASTDSFEYTVSDGNGGTATATVTVNRL